MKLKELKTIITKGNPIFADVCKQFYFSQDIK